MAEQGREKKAGPRPRRRRAAHGDNGHGARAGRDEGGGSAASGKRSKVALICTGGGLTGGLYQIGCLRALDEVLSPRSVVDLDLFIGMSSGAFLNAMLANGMRPAQLYDMVHDPARGASSLDRMSLLGVNAEELVGKLLDLPRIASTAVADYVRRRPELSLTDLLLALNEAFPSGLFHNRGIEEFLAQLFAEPGRTDSFRALQRELYVGAVDLDSAQSVIFGAPPWDDVPISKAVRASTALPLLYHPVRVDNADFVDGTVRKTAHLSLAIERGAELLIILNPIVPFRNNIHAHNLPLLRGRTDYLSQRGLSYVFDQVFRMVVHGRMRYGVQRYRQDHPEVDMILIEPAQDDVRMFFSHIMSASARRLITEHGLDSTRRFFSRRWDELAPLFARHGLSLTPPAAPTADTEPTDTAAEEEPTADPAWGPATWLGAAYRGLRRGLGSLGV